MLITFSNFLLAHKGNRPRVTRSDDVRGSHGLQFLGAYSNVSEVMTRLIPFRRKVPHQSGATVSAGFTGGSRALLPALWHAPLVSDARSSPCPATFHPPVDTHERQIRSACWRRAHEYVRLLSSMRERDIGVLGDTRKVSKTRALPAR